MYFALQYTLVTFFNKDINTWVSIGVFSEIVFFSTKKYELPPSRQQSWTLSNYKEKCSYGLMRFPAVIHCFFQDKMHNFKDYFFTVFVDWHTAKLQEYVHMFTSSSTAKNKPPITLQCRHNGCDSVSTYQPHDYLFNRLFRRRSKNTSKLRVTGLCAGNSPGTGEFPTQMASYTENDSTWWCHHDHTHTCLLPIPTALPWSLIYKYGLT